ncbi:hypothetical protein PMAYCL1PPCAC_33086, partial [Pristionchus mayeri]
VMHFKELSQEIKKLSFEVLANSNINPLDKEVVQFERIGLDRGYNAAIFKLSLEDGRSFAIKISDNRDHYIILHNRELEFYKWLEGVRSESDCEEEDLMCLLKFFGGTKCDAKPGVLIFNDLSSRVGIQPNYVIGYSLALVFQIVKQIAGYQSVYLSSEKEISVGNELIKYVHPVQKTMPKLDAVPWMTDDEKRYLREWTVPQNLWSIHTEIPEEIEGISPVLIHTDLWNGNILFEQRENSTRLLSILDWQTSKIGNPLIDIATIIGENMTTEDRREYTEAILSLYLDEIEKRKSRFKKRFEMTKEKARVLLSLALRWPCIQTMFAVVLNPSDDPKEEGHEMGRLSLRLRELMNDVLRK